MNPNDTVAHYRITGKLGEGGMGAVYRATDTKLGRDVAVKVLPESFANDPDRLGRFTREAQLLASLNHPNIAAIYGVEERALVLELVEGETLADRLARGALPLDEALPIARQIAEALEYAHERGIIHRDLKPANVKVTPEGRVKVLDFGLAKAMAAERSQAEVSATVTMGASVAGMIMGTPGYMSPEQAKGKPVDRRADIWAFGVLLAEMLGGGALYRGETVSEILAAVLLKEPDLTNLPANTPGAVRRLIGRCLDKDPLRRLRDIGEARVTLEQPLREEVPIAAPVSAPAARQFPWGWVAAAVLAVALAAALYFRPVEDRRAIRFTIQPPENATMRALPIPVISPDGKRVAYVAAVAGDYTIWIRDLDSLTSRSLPGTSGAAAPFWSPDGRFLGFVAGGDLKKIDAGGGSPVKISSAAPVIRGASWSTKGVILFASVTGGIQRVPEDGGTPEAATTIPQGSGENSHRYPWFLPDGRHFLYYSRNNDMQKNALYVGDLQSGERQLITTAQSDGIYAAPGYLLYLRDRSLVAQPFDAGSRKLTGNAVPIAEDVGIMGSDGRAPFSASANGVLAYMTNLGFTQTRLTWFDRSGKELGTLGPTGAVQWPAISPDGKIVAVDRMDERTSSWDIWLHDLTRGAMSRLTFDNKISEFPVWSPDGAFVAFHSNRDGSFKMYRKAANGSGAEELLDNADRRVDDWSRDGRYVIEESGISSAESSNDLWVLPLEGDRKPFAYLATRARERWGRVSPDGRWLAYSVAEADQYGVYVTTFPTQRGKWLVSNDVGDMPAWSRDGKELFYRGRASRIMAVSVSAGPGERFEAGIPKVLFQAAIAGLNSRFDVAPDGRFLIPMEPQSTAAPPITVVVNWNAGLRR